MRNWILCLAHLMVTAGYLSGAEIPRNLLKGLSSDVFKERENSQAQLLLWAEQGGKDEVFSIYKLSKDLTDPEVSLRCLNVLKQLSDRDYLSDGQGYLGIQMLEEMADLPGDENPRACIRITRVVQGSPAHLSGIRSGDLITALNGKKWYELGAMDIFMREISDTKPLEPVILTIRRKDEDMFDVEILLGKRPAENLFGINQDLKLLDQRAREQYFEKWLKSLEAHK